MKKLKYFGFMAIVLLALTGCGKEEVEEKKKEEPKETILLKEDLKLEINSEVTLLSLVSKDNKAEIISKDETVDTSVLGEKELVIAYKENDEEKEYKFKVNVVDTEGPAIECKTELSTNVGTKIDLLKGVKVSDNSKEEIKATVEGEYDINKEGTYDLKYVAVDSSNNKTEEKFTLKVNKKAAAVSKPQTSNDTPSASVEPSRTCKQATKNQYDFVDNYEDKKYCGEYISFFVTFAWHPFYENENSDKDGAMVLYHVSGGMSNTDEKYEMMGFEDATDLYDWVDKYAKSIIPTDTYYDETDVCIRHENGSCEVKYTHETKRKVIYIYTGRPEQD